MINVAEAILSSPHADAIAAAVEAGALLFRLEGELYAAVREEWGWWVYELSPGSNEYGVSKDYSTCSCPAPKPCKHIRALKYNPEAKSAHA